MFLSAFTLAAGFVFAMVFILAFVFELGVRMGIRVGGNPCWRSYRFLHEGLTDSPWPQTHHPEYVLPPDLYSHLRSRWR
jgi:hypothetical protein